MIVHVYNPERIVNNGTSKTNSKVVVPPPPSPKLLRHSGFKSFQSRGAAAAESPCLLNKRLRDKEEATAMDSSSDGLWSNLPTASQQQPSQMACTCHCSSGSSQETSGHYFTPVSSFTMEEDSKEPDSLEYKNERTSVRESPPMRKASLDRILSPQVQRRPVYFSSPHSSGAAAAHPPGDKSLSPVVPVPLSTSMSNASIHSNYSEDSLTATPAGQRWNKYGQWIADSGSCMEQRPSTAVNSSSLDFSKDSLNTSSALQEPEEEEGEEEEESESCSSSVKLEPLAFTIDFGDVTPVHKKKETPKRLAERLTSARHSSTTTKSTCESTSESKNAKMLKSLSSRLGGGGHQLPPLKFGEVEASVPHNSRRSATPNSKGESSSSSRNSSVNRASQNNNNNGSAVAQQQQRKSSKVGLKQRTPSPTPPSSPVKSGRPPPPPALGSSSRNRHKQQQQQQSDPEGIEDEEEIVLVDNEGVGTNDAAEEEELIQQQQTGDDDTASETGTYTIGKDSPSPDEDQSRRDIDRVFGLVVSAASIPLDSSNSSASGNHPQWVSDWAAQVVQQQEAAAMLPSGVSVKPPSHPQHRPPPPELPTTARPRRKLPSLPPVSTPRSRSSTRPSPAEMSDPSDSSLETESFLRDTESVVSAMQARMDGRSSTESDVETRSSSTSYRPTSAQLPGGDIENSRKLSAQLRAKIRSLDESYQQSTATATNSTPSGNIRKGSYVISSSSSGGTAVTQAGVNNVIHNELHGSGGEDAKSLHSDSSLSDITSGETSSRSRHHENHKAAGQNAPTVRYNRALSLRRGRLGLDGDQANVPNPSGGGGSPSRGSSPQVPAPSARKLSSASGQSQASSRAGSTASASSFSRNDGGRFSLRVGSNKPSSSTTSTVKPKVSKNTIQQQQPANLPPMGGPRKSRSNSTLSSKEAEFQNWKRRKNYDPMKAAAEGKKKEAARRSTTLTMSQSMIGPVASSISPSSQSPSPPPRTIIRSASFTCVNSSKSRSGLERSSEIQQEMEMKYSNGNRRTSHRKPSSMFYSSEDETETMYSSSSPSKKAISKTGSAASTRAHYLGLNLMPSSSSSTHLQYRHHNSSPPSLPADFSDLASITSNDIDLNSSPGSPRRKHYMEDGLLMRTSASNSSLRARTKLEALDNLVISTIHGLSSKIRGNAEGLLRKLRPQYLDDLERLGLIDDTLNRLADCVTESPIHAVTGGRSSSRELSGTLKVMKRVEQVFQALDQVLFEEVLEGGGEEGAILNDGGTTTEGEDWNGGYTSGDFY